MQSIGNIAELGKVWKKNSGNSDFQKLISNSIGDLLKGNSYNQAIDMLKKANITGDLADIAMKASQIKQPAMDAAQAITGLGKTSSFVDGLKLAFSGLITTITAHPIIAAITGITAAILIVPQIIDAVTTSLDEYIEAGEKAKDTISETYSEYDSANSGIQSLARSYADSTEEIIGQKDAVESLGDTYEELSRGINKFDNSNVSLSDEEYQSYLDISNKLAEMFPSLVSGYDSQKNAILSLGEGAESASEQLQHLLDVSAQMANIEIGDNIQAVFDGVVAQAEKSRNTIEDLELDLKSLYGGMSEVESSPILEWSVPSLDDAQAIIPDYEDALDTVLKEYGDYIADYDYTQFDGKNAIKILFDESVTSDVLDDFKATVPEIYEGLNQEVATEANKTQQQIEAENLKIADAWKSLTEPLTNLISTKDSFMNLNDRLQSAFLTYFQGLDLQSVFEGYGFKDKYEDVEDFIYGEYLTPMSNLSDEVQDILSQILEIDYSDMDLGSYYERINSLMEKAFPEDIKTQGYWKNILGINNLAKDYAEQIKTVKEQISDLPSEIDSLSISDLEIAFDLVANDKFSGTFEELQEEIAKVREEAETPFDITATPQMDTVEGALESENKGSNFEKIAGYIEQAQDLYNQGLVGTDDFKKIAALLSPTGMEDVVNFEENIGRMMEYFDTESADGVKAFLDDLQALNKGYVDLDESTGQYLISMYDLEQAAQDMGMSFETFMAMLGRTSDYGFTHDFFSTEEEGLNHLSDLYSQLSEQEMKLMELTDNDGIMDGNQTAIQATKDKIDELNFSIQTTIGYLDLMSQKTAEDYNNEIESAKTVLSSRYDQYEEAGKYQNSEEVRRRIVQDMQEVAGEYGIDLSEFFTINEDGLIEEVTPAFQELQKEIEKYSQMDFSPISSELSESIKTGIQQGIDSGDPELQNYINTLKQGQYTPEELNSITFGDQQLDENLGEAELAIDGILNKLGLSQDEAQAVVQILGELGIIDIEVEAENPEKVVEDVKDATEGSSVEVEIEPKIETPEQTLSPTIAGLPTYDLPDTAEGVATETAEPMKQPIEAEDASVPTEQAQEYANQNPIDIALNAKPPENYTMPELQAPDTSLSPDIDIQANTEAAEATTQSFVDSVDDTTGTMKIDGDDSLAEAKRLTAKTNIDNTTGTIKVDANTSNIPSQIQNTLNGNTFSINVRANVTGMPSGGASSPVAVAHGTPFIQSAHFNDGIVGRAYSRGGTVGEPEDTEALTGELGPEIIVRNNRFFTVGENGPEFVHLKKGDIVFNHKQTRELLSKGRTGTRGRALAEGNARAGVGGAIGGFQAGAAGKQLNDDGIITANSDAIDANTNAIKSNTDATDKENEKKEESLKVYDWVAVRLTRLGEATARIANKITDFISFAEKATLLNKQIRSVEREETANSKAYRTYMRKANSIQVKDDDGNVVGDLPNSWKRKVQKGEYNIEDVKDSNLAEAIDSYQEYYEKAIAAKDAVQELKNTQLELFEDLVNIPIEKAEKKVNRLADAMDRLSGFTDVASSGASGINALVETVDSTTGENIRQAQKQVKKDKKTTSKKRKAANQDKKERNKAGAKLTNQLAKKGVDADTQKEVRNAVNSGKKLDKATVEYLKKYGLGKQATQYNTKATSAIKSTKALKNAKSNQTEDQKYLAMLSVLDPAQETLLDNEGSSTVDIQNALLEENLSQKRETLDTWNDTLVTTQRTAAQKKVEKEQAQQDKKDAKNKMNRQKKKIQNNDKMMKNLNASQKKQLRSGQKVSTKGITDKATLKAIKAYNASLNSYTKASDKAKEATEKYNIAAEAHKEANANATEAQEEYAQALIDTANAEIENVQNAHESDIALAESQHAMDDANIELKQSLGYDLDSSDFQKQIANAREEQNRKIQQANAMQAELDRQVSLGRIEYGSEEWDEWQSQINGVRTEAIQLEQTQHELADDMRNNLNLEFERAIENAERLRSSYATLKGLISDDSWFDDNGKFTNAGLLSLDLSIKDYELNKDSLESILQQRQDIIDRYNNGNDPEYSKQEFDADMADITEQLNNALTSTNETRQEVIDMIAAQAKAELEAINEVIDAQKEAIQTKEEYYDYDKNLKDQSKEIQLLRKRVQALNGVTDAESKAEKARLEAQLAEAEEGLQDTIHDHAIQMQVEGLDDLKVELQENYDNYVKDLNSNLDLITKTIEDATTKVNAVISSTTEVMNKLLNSYGVAGLTSDKLNYQTDTGYARGIRRVPHDQLAYTQEKGAEIIMSDGQMITPLKKGDSVFNNDMTNKLYSLANNYNEIMAGLSTSSAPQTIYSEPVAPISITIEKMMDIGSVTKDSIPELQRMIPEIAKKVAKEIYKDNRKAGWK